MKAGPILNQGVAKVPNSPPGATPTPATVTPGAQGGLAVRALSWRRGVLTLVVRGVPSRAHLSIRLVYPHQRPRKVTSRHERVRIHTRKPQLMIVRAVSGHQQVGEAVTAPIQ